jgi:hypothetical protein
MINPMTSILRRNGRERSKYNILCAPTHERYETGLAMTGHNFYALRADGIKNWNSTYAPIPSNYILLDKDLGAGQLPLHIEFDFVLSQNKFGQYQILKDLADKMHLPLISLEHTLPIPSWSEQTRQHLKSMGGDLNVFISSFSINEWRYEQDERTRVVHHMVDTDVFSYSEKTRNNRILSVVNDWINRDWCCNFSGWQRITKGLPTLVVGDTPGLSEPAKTVEELVSYYRDSTIFINTSTVSPVPTALLEAMSCGCAVVSTATCMIPEVITNGHDGFISNDERELRSKLEFLLNNPSECRRLGYNARQTILKRFNKETFISKWNSIFDEAANIIYTGGING